MRNDTASSVLSKPTYNDLPVEHARKVGKYELHELLGAGAMGTVYRAVDPVLRRDVAIKLMSPAVASDAHLRHRFHREARTAGSLQHPNIVTIHDFGEADGHLFIAMEYVEGQDLYQLISDRAPLNLIAKLGIALDILTGLDYAHRRGITHRDIKPGNIRLTSEGRAKIMDFGIAHLAESELTNPGLVLGTPSYMAPELLKGGDPSPVTDVFSVGAVLYELLTFRRPFDGDTTHAVLYKVLSEEPQPLHQLDPSLPPRIREMVKRAMAKIPESRYQSAAEMASDLKAACVALTTGDMSTVVVSRHRGLTLRGRAKITAAALTAALGAIWTSGAPARPVLAGGQIVPMLEPIFAVSPPQVPVAGQDTMLVAVRDAAFAKRFRADSIGVPIALLDAGDRYIRQADSLVAAGRFSEAILAISTAGAKWAESEASHLARSRQPRRASSPQGSGRDTARSQPAAVTRSRAPAPPTRDDPARIAMLIDSLALALESRSIDNLRTVYRHLSDRESESWAAFFETVKQLRLVLNVRELMSEGDSAVANVDGNYTYVTDQGQQQRTMSFPVTLRLTDGAWQIVHLGSTKPGQR